MARPLLIANPENATIEELKQVSRVGSNETAARCTAIQMLLVGAHRDLVCNALLVSHHLASLATKVLAAIFARLKSHRTNLADDESTLVQQRCL